LGATLFALISGKPPFSGTAAQILVAHQLTKPPNLTKLVASVPPQLSAIIAKLMAKKPEKRFRDAGEVIDALLPFSHSGEPSSLPVTVKPISESVTVKVADSQRKTTKATPPTKPLEARKNNEKRVSFSVTPRTAMTVMVTCLGLGLITLLVLFLINGSDVKEPLSLVNSKSAKPVSSAPATTNPGPTTSNK
jgi:serine/threonine protein kinase